MKRGIAATMQLFAVMMLLATVLNVGCSSKAQRLERSSHVSSKSTDQRCAVWDNRDQKSPAHYTLPNTINGMYKTACGQLLSGGEEDYKFSTVEDAASQGRKPCPDCIEKMETTYLQPAIWRNYYKPAK